MSREEGSRANTLKKLLLKECWGFFFQDRQVGTDFFFFKDSASFSSFQNLPSFTIHTKDIPPEEDPYPIKTSPLRPCTHSVWRNELVTDRAGKGGLTLTL